MEQLSKKTIFQGAQQSSDAELSNREFRDQHVLELRSMPSFYWMSITSRGLINTALDLWPKPLPVACSDNLLRGRLLQKAG